MTARLSKELQDVLLGDAERNGITASSLVNRIVKKYVEWDRHAEKFKFVLLSADAFRTLLELMDDKTLTNAAETINLEYLEALTLFWFKKINLDTVLETVNLLGKYSGLFEHELDHIDGSHVISLKHGLGKKWSYYVGALIRQFIKKELNVVLDIVCTDETAVITLRMGPSGDRGSVG
jgi:hypothetical protein